jgi:hypothetical protein
MVEVMKVDEIGFDGDEVFKVPAPVDIGDAIKEEPDDAR